VTRDLKRLAWGAVAAVAVVAAVLGVAAVLAGRVDDTETQVFATLVELVVSTVVVLAGLAVLERRHAVSLARWLVAAGPLTAVLLTFAIWAGEDIAWQATSTWLVGLALAAALVAASALFERRQLAVVAALLAVAAPVAAGLMLVPIWSESLGSSDLYAEVGMTVGIVAVTTLAVATLRLLVHAPQLVRTVFTADAVCACAAASVAIAIVWSDTVSDGVVRALLALLILTALGYVLIPVLERVLTRSHDRPRAA
jgi:hypothetical protein